MIVFSTESIARGVLNKFLEELNYFKQYIKLINEYSAENTQLPD